MADSSVKERTQISRRDQLERWRNQKKQNATATVRKTNKSDNAGKRHPLTLKNPLVCGKRVSVKATKPNSSKIKECGSSLIKTSSSIPSRSQTCTPRNETERQKTNIHGFRPQKRLQSPTSRAAFKTPSSKRHIKPSRTTSALKISKGHVPHSLSKSMTQCSSRVIKNTCSAPRPVASSGGSSCPNKVYFTPCSARSDMAAAPINTPTTKPRQDKALNMRERLELWLTEKGKTPKVSKYQTPATIKRKRNLKTQVMSGLGADTPSGVHRTSQGTPSVPSVDVEILSCDLVREEPPSPEMEAKLRDYLTALRQYDCSYDSIAVGLDECQRSWPGLLRLALYWVCRAKLAELEGDENRVVCFFEQALVFNAQPESLIKDAVCGFVQSMKDRKSEETSKEPTANLASPEALATLNASGKSPPSSPDPAPALTQRNNTNPDDETESLMFDSSIIKFCLSEATPYKRRLKSCFNKPVLTPVRRSMRLEKASYGYPTMLQEHSLTVRSLDELPEEMQEEILYKPNMAVQAELNEAWMEMQQTL